MTLLLSRILDSIISKLNGTFQNMSLSVTRPNGTKLNALVEVRKSDSGGKAVFCPTQCGHFC